MRFLGRESEAEGMEYSLQMILREHSLHCGAVFDEKGEILARAGDFSKLSADGMVSTVLGPRGSALASYGLLRPDEKVRPALLSEGREFALLERVGILMVVVFGLDRAEGMEHLLFSRRVGASITERFS